MSPRGASDRGFAEEDGGGAGGRRRPRARGRAGRRGCPACRSGARGRLLRQQQLAHAALPRFDEFVVKLGSCLSELLQRPIFDARGHRVDAVLHALRALTARKTLSTIRIVKNPKPGPTHQLLCIWQRLRRRGGTLLARAEPDARLFLVAVRAVADGRLVASALP